MCACEKTFTASFNSANNQAKKQTNKKHQILDTHKGVILMSRGQSSAFMFHGALSEISLLQEVKQCLDATVLLAAAKQMKVEF